MTPEQFTYWLQGFFELENPKTLSLRQTQMIKEHLQLCFVKVTKLDVNKRQVNVPFDDLQNPTRFNDFPFEFNQPVTVC